VNDRCRQHTRPHPPRDSGGRFCDIRSLTGHRSVRHAGCVTSDAAPATRPLWRRVTGSFWFHLIAAFLVFGAILSFVAKPYSVPSGSMEQTLLPGDRVLVNQIGRASCRERVAIWVVRV